VRAARQLRANAVQSSGDIAGLLDDPPAGFDPEVLRELETLRDRARAAWSLRDACSHIPADLRRLIEWDILTIEQVGALNLTLGIASGADLIRELEAGTIAAVDGFNASLRTTLITAIETLRNETPRIPLGRAAGIARSMLARLASVPGVSWAEAAGSIRRGEDTVGDIELIAATTDVDAVVTEVLDDDAVEDVLHRAPRRLYVAVAGTQVGIRCVEPRTSGAVLLHMTGSAAHLTSLRRIASERGWTLDASGLRHPDGRQLAASEEEIYEALNLQMIPPELRTGAGEIEAARQRAIPHLLTRSAIKGDLHMHSLWSDGRSSTEAMIQSAIAIGHEYIAITDHSERSAASHTLTVDALERQSEEIARLRERYPQIVILHGCEVDIMPSGALDFPDAVLERLDIVLASLHDRAGHSPARLLERYLGAMRHPLVSLITHPGNRLVPHRAAYEIDYDRLFEAAVETGTAVEIDGAPGHLDLDGAAARRAAAAGATIVVDSDCHRAELLDFQMRLGVTMARRGWVEARHVLNTRPIDAVGAFIAAKRTARL
jgi:DNA polymerase (family 10)